VADWLSEIEPGIDGNFSSDGKAMRLKVVLTVTVTVLFELAAGEVAVAATVMLPGASALAAAAKLVQPDGRERPAPE
jgi:hypothetical protein